MLCKKAKLGSEKYYFLPWILLENCHPEEESVDIFNR